MKICRNCQEEFSDKVTKCLYCGGPVEIVPTPGQRILDEPDKKEQSGIEPGKIWKYYKIPIITIIVLVAGVLFIILQKPDVNKSAQQENVIETPKVYAPAASAPESSSAPEVVPAPGSADDLFNNAFALCSSGKCTDAEKAIEYLNELIKMKPDLVEAYNNRGNAYSDLGQYQLAIEDYFRAIRLKRDYALAYNNRGHAYAAIGKYEWAIEDYDKAISLNPDYALTYRNRGLTYGRDLGQYQRAVEDFNEAIRLNPDDASTYDNRGNAYFMQANKELGCSDGQKACDLGDCKLLEWAKGKGFCH